MPPDLEIQLLGDVRVLHRGELLPIDSHRLQALLAYLILHRGAPQQRRRIAFQFWPDSTEAQALTNLRQLLHHLRRALPGADQLLRAERGTLTWSERAPARIDLLELEAAWAAAEQAAAGGDVEEAIRAGERAAALYAGELLPGCYDEWVEPERNRLERGAREALHRLIAALESRHEHARAIPHAERLTEIDPLSEPAHRALIRLLALAGDRSGAARVFHAWAATLDRELGTAPAAQTRALFESSQRGELTDAGKQTSAAPAPEEEPLPLIGRAEEWARLRAAWERAADGPRLLLITGEAGIGKTRLAESLAEFAERQGFATGRARCWAAEGLLPLAPVAQWLRSPPFQEPVRGLDATWRAEVARVLPELRPGGAAENPEPGRRIRLFDALARAVLAPAGPLLLLLDDLQWCDGETLEWLHYLLRFDPAPPLLLVVTLRSGEPAADPGLPQWLLHMRQRQATDTIALAPLPPSQTGALGAAVVRRDLDPEEVAGLHRETEGNPLFIVETVRARMAHDEPASRGAGEAALPPRVQAVIRGRLDRLSADAADLVGLLATLGRDFTLPLLRAAEPGDRHRLAGALDDLVAAHVIRERDGGYDFSHDKIREVAYAELGQARRSLLHERAARALIAASGGAAEGVAGEVARHFERAGMGDAAIPWYRRAADRARGLFANREAATYLERALALLLEEPATEGRAERELELQVDLGVPLVALHHYSGPRVWRAYNRARELCERLGRRPDAPVLRGLAMASLMRSRVADVLELGRSLARLAEEDRDPMLKVEAQYVLGVALYWQGDPGAARTHLQRALDLYDPKRGPDHLRLFSQDPGIICGVRLALAEWHLEGSEAAHRRCLEVIRRAELLAHPFSLAYARLFGSWVLINCGDLDEARRQIPALLRDSEEHGMSVWPAMGSILEGWLMTRDGRGEAGLERMRRAAADFAASEVDLGFPYHQALYADACLRAGDADAALAAVDDGLAMSARTGEAFWDPELLRLRGAALRESHAPSGAVEESFRRGLEAARDQAAPPFERRIRATQNAPGTVHR